MIVKNEDIALSERITRWRESRNLTKAGLARLMGVSSAVVTLWEQGESSMSIESVAALAKALDITVSEFWSTPPKLKAAKAS